jgi:hypothetical protein
MAAAFAATSPFVLLDFRTFLGDFLFEVRHLAGAGETPLARGWVRHAVFTLPTGVGLPMLLAAAAGAGALWKRDRGLAAVVLGFPAVYYLLAGKGYTVFVRYALPVVPFVCLLAAVGVSAAAQAAQARGLTPGAAARLAAALGGLVALVPLTRSADFDRLMSRPDTRALAVAFARARLPPGVRIGWIGTTYGCPLFPLTPQALERQLAAVRAGGGSGRLIEARLDAARRAGYGVDLETIERGAAAGDRALPEYVLTESYPLVWVEKATAGIEALLERRGYRPLARFAGGPPDVLQGSGMRYDAQDAFYAPFAGMRRLTNPGPSLTLWRRDRRVVE